MQPLLLALISCHASMSYHPQAGMQFHPVRKLWAILSEQYWPAKKDTPKRWLRLVSAGKDRVHWPAESNVADETQPTYPSN